MTTKNVSLSADGHLSDVRASNLTYASFCTVKLKSQVLSRGLLYTRTIALSEDAYSNHITSEALLSSDPKTLRGNTKNPQSVIFFFLSLPLMPGQKGWHCFCRAGMDLSSHMREPFFDGVYEREAHHLDGMQKCRQGEEIASQVEKREGQIIPQYAVY